MVDDDRVSGALDANSDWPPDVVLVLGKTGGVLDTTVLGVTVGGVFATALVGVFGPTGAETAGDLSAERVGTAVLKPIGDILVTI